MAKVKIRVKKPWIGFSGTPIQQNYAEELDHGYLLWDIQGPSTWNVDFHKLPNPKPYVTLVWSGDHEELLSSAQAFPDGSRFRIRSSQQLGQKDLKKISELLKEKKLATEVTFKSDYVVEKSIVKTEEVVLEKSNLRNADVLLKLVKDYHKNSQHPEELWTQAFEQIKRHLSTVVASEDVLRNSKWSLRYLGFDNMFSYGDNNIINFDKLNGIVGIFGTNRAGKSSIVGTLMYTLFNSTDRGSIKNLHVCNIRKPYCSSKAIINHSGIDYVIERQTTKSENKKGVISASTALNVFRINADGNADDLGGEQRIDTEKTIKMLLGSQEDFLMTSLSAQGETTQFISQGSTRRRAILSRFLDLDVFDKLYDLSNKELNQLKAQMKNYPDRDWVGLLEKQTQDLSDSQARLDFLVEQIEDSRSQLSRAQFELTKHSESFVVIPQQVEEQKEKVSLLERKIEDSEKKLKDLNLEIEQIDKKIESIKIIKHENDISVLRGRLAAQKDLESTLLSLQHAYDKKLTSLKQAQKSLKILEEVPCGINYPTCRFIKDAHFDKETLKDQLDEVDAAKNRLSDASISLDTLRQENIQVKLDKLEKLFDLETKLLIDLSKKQSEKSKIEDQLDANKAQLVSSKDHLNDLENATKNKENVAVVSIKTKIENLLTKIKSFDFDKMELATKKGRLIESIEKLSEEKRSRDAILESMKAHEITSLAFSKKGLPLIITKSQLPVINAEIARVLHGIVDFTIELENDEESDSTEIYINYGDSRRIIELCSGMEKTIASLAVRVAMTNMSSLPRPDIFIIDEGFGTLDDAAVEACNRLLISLKKYFRVIVVITHVDGIKDVVDHVLDITKFEKDAKVVYE